MEWCKVIEFYGKDIPDLDTFLKQCIQKFKLPVITPEEDEDEQFPDYNIPDPLHGLSYAMMDLSNISDYPQQPIMMVIHDQMKFCTLRIITIRELYGTCLLVRFFHIMTRIKKSEKSCSTSF
ncbi:Uncharacterised protein [Weissella viridescens]|uniref:Uncharacterized protein n=1 Tax=Weissella viridescens TaxID=1629 RepID=A0A380P2V4_WEIVI|nr:Uncharacterised protein [Weissella viridescens]